ncbi:MAG: CheR family methyltransferase, partial [Planctomycetota bacterium]
MPELEISEKNFVWLTQLIQEQAGIQIKENGVQMLQNRISKRVCELGANSVEDYCEVIRKDLTGTEIATLIDAVTTNYTSFFRDPRQFEQLAEFFEERLNRSRLNVRVWSAACSTGEELYSIAMVAQETATKLCEPMSRFRLLGTDIANS